MFPRQIETRVFFGGGGRLDEERAKIRAAAAKKAAEEHELKDAEKDKRIGDLVK